MKPFGALAAGAALLAVLLGTLAAVMSLPASVEIALTAGALVLVACAGGLIGVAVAAARRSGA